MHKSMKRTALLSVLAFVFIVTARGDTIGGVHFFTPLAPNIYLAEPRFGGGNSTIIITSEGVVIVDTQNSPAAAAILIEEIARLTDKKVITIITTHWHGDHHGGNSAFLDMNPNIKIIAHRNT